MKKNSLFVLVSCFIVSCLSCSDFIEQEKMIGIDVYETCISNNTESNPSNFDVITKLRLFNKSDYTHNFKYADFKSNDLVIITQREKVVDTNTAQFLGLLGITDTLSRPMSFIDLDKLEVSLHPYDTLVVVYVETVSLDMSDLVFNGEKEDSRNSLYKNQVKSFLGLKNRKYSLCINKLKVSEDLPQATGLKQCVTR